MNSNTPPTGQQKVAADAELSAAEIQKVATFAFSTVLASPVMGHSQDVVVKAATAFKAGLVKAAARQERIVELIKQHVSADRPARA